MRTLVNCELRTVSQDFLLEWYIALRFCLCALCKYSLIVYSEPITFPCINLICLIYVLQSKIIIIIIIIIIIFYCQDSFCTVPIVI